MPIENIINENKIMKPIKYHRLIYNDVKQLGKINYVFPLLYIGYEMKLRLILNRIPPGRFEETIH